MPDYPRPLPGFDYRGPHRYFLTFCTFERNELFADEVTVDLVRTQFRRASADTGIDVLAYCFMRDHVHLLVQGMRDDADMKSFVKRAKQCAGFHFRKATGRTLWQRYGYERVLRGEEDTPSIVKYIIENPLRAGLVTSPMDYPYWGSEVYSREQLLEYVAAAYRKAG